MASKNKSMKINNKKPNEVVIESEDDNELLNFYEQANNIQKVDQLESPDEDGIGENDKEDDEFYGLAERDLETENQIHVILFFN